MTKALDSAVFADVQTLKTSFARKLESAERSAVAVSALGITALVLACLGIVGLVTYAVSQRTKEIGIRMALGAHRGQAVWTVARRVAILVGAGTIAGLGVTLLAIVGLGAAAAPAPGITLYRPAAEPLALLAIAAVMAVVALAAAVIPARKAASVNPLTALRTD